MNTLVSTGIGTATGNPWPPQPWASAAVRRRQRGAAVKPTQTGLRPGEPSEVDEVQRLVPDVDTIELYREPEPLALTTAAQRSRLPAPDLDAVADAVTRLATTHGLVQSSLRAGGWSSWTPPVVDVPGR